MKCPAKERDGRSAEGGLASIPSGDWRAVHENWCPPADAEGVGSPSGGMGSGAGGGKGEGWRCERDWETL